MCQMKASLINMRLTSRYSAESYAFAVKGFCALFSAFEIRSGAQSHGCTDLSTLCIDKSHTYLPLPRSFVCNLPDSGRYVTSVFQGLSLSLARSVGRVGENPGNEVVHKFDQLLFGKADIIVHTDPKPLEAIFKRSVAYAPRRLQSMLLSLQRYNFWYRKGSTLLIADTLSRPPLPMSPHEPQLQSMIWCTELNSKVNTPIYQVSQMSPSMTSTSQPQQIEQIALRTLVESGWPTKKASVPESVRLYWDVRSELKLNEGLL